MDFMTVIRDAGAFIVVLASVLAATTTVSKTLRNFWRKIFKVSSRGIEIEQRRQGSAIEDVSNKLTIVLDRMDKIEAVSRQQCRDTLKEIYYKYQGEKKIPLYERKTADRTWEIYSSFPNANSYAALLYHEICKWEIDSVSYQDLNES